VLQNLNNIYSINEAKVNPKTTKTNADDIPVFVYLNTVNGSSTIKNEIQHVANLNDILLHDNTYDFYPIIKPATINNRQKYGVVVVTEYSVNETKRFINNLPEVKNKKYVVNTMIAPQSTLDTGLKILILNKLNAIQNSQYVKNFLTINQKHINNEYNAAIKRANNLTNRSEYRTISNTLGVVATTREFISKMKNELDNKNMIDPTTKSDLENKIKALYDATDKIKSIVKEIVDSIKQKILDLETLQNFTKTDLNQLINIVSKIQSLYNADLIPSAEKQSLLNTIENIKTKFKIDTKTVNSQVGYAQAKDLATKINDFIDNMPHKKNEIISKYQDLLLEISYLERTNKQDAKYLKRGLDEAVKTALAILIKSEETKKTKKSKDGEGVTNNEKQKTQGDENVANDKNAANNKKPNDEKSEYDDPKAKDKELLIDYENEKIFSKYELNVYLPLNRYVKITNLSNLEVDNISGSKDVMYNDMLHSISRSLDALIGYKATGLAANTVNAMIPVTYAIGNLASLFTRFSANTILGSMARAKHGFFGKKADRAYEKVANNSLKLGEFIKYEIINQPEQINPVSAEFADYMSDKFHLKRKAVSHKYLSSTHSRYTPVPKTVGALRDVSSSANKGDLFEDMGGAMVDSGPGGEAGIPGNGFGSSTTMGNPIPPTPDQTPFVDGKKTEISDSGSGDIFDKIYGINKKKKKIL